ncbi:hypothetical protein DM01DRAFT_1410359 [Hesseltinella vesiculosa]|uniref:Uncharacterized protein n=1 Tax=Hesseltinella vesiculosa TaxID=101127 RepID=A0A1X2G785_9FUNG|nr:hypothetical protein DM01DRAFT_1410359 [Hesseltinella vesiculosa]
MKLTLFVSCLLAAVASTNVLVRADSLQDQIDAARNKFCGGIAIQVTVTRKPNAQANIVSAVDVYTIQSGKSEYVGTAWKGNYALNQKATLSVDLSKTKGLKFPSQFEYRVWVHNKAGPDCTLMSKMFRVSSSAHTNDVEQEFSSLYTNVDRGRFGVDLVSPAIGEHKKANEGFNVQIQRDSSSHLENIESLVMYTISLDSRTPQQV